MVTEVFFPPLVLLQACGEDNLWHHYGETLWRWPGVSKRSVVLSWCCHENWNVFFLLSSCSFSSERTEGRMKWTPGWFACSAWRLGNFHCFSTINTFICKSLNVKWFTEDGNMFCTCLVCYIELNDRDYHFHHHYLLCFFLIFLVLRITSAEGEREEKKRTTYWPSSFLTWFYFSASPLPSKSPETKASDQR